ncbi:hypothetical protein [Desulforamulus aquiferis]|uniref:Uncharacterized protein n=1 Tax=Desulforamulus aquiferis TaxID=1397668 RepID=A0AAW7ZD31_9FIRM|nr:hypothetical protein [Desulforamulus aquiferis]MDO7787241.1 hypothetical protein [Desulforamulus aquiferis]
MSVFYFFNPNNKLGINYMSPTLYGGFLPHPYADLECPNMYLDFCLEDIKQNDLRSRTNAFSNCKKAIHLRVDLILNQYGLLMPNIKCDFPTKLQIVELVGLLPTLMLKNINDERNLIEHDYRVPEEKRVKEVIDVAELLYMATDKILGKTPIEVIIGFDTEPLHRVMRIEPQKGQLEFFGIKAKKEEVMKFNEDFNIYFIKEKLRGIDGRILPFYEIDEEVCNRIDLSYTNRENWELIINQLYSIVKNDAFNNTGAYKENCISTVVHIPISSMHETALSDFLIRNFNSRLKK